MCEDPLRGLPLPTHTYPLLSSYESWVSHEFLSRDWKSNIYERGVPLKLQMIVMHIPHTLGTGRVPLNFSVPISLNSFMLSSSITLLFSGSNPLIMSSIFTFNFTTGFAGNLNCLQELVKNSVCIDRHILWTTKLKNLKVLNRSTVKQYNNKYRWIGIRVIQHPESQKSRQPQWFKSWSHNLYCMLCLDQYLSH